jgi:hypothetical protein
MSQWLRTLEQRIASREGVHHALSDPRISTYHFEMDLNQTSSKPEHFAGTFQRARIMQGRVRPERTSGPTEGE